MKAIIILLLLCSLFQLNNTKGFIQEERITDQDLLLSQSTLNLKNIPDPTNYIRKLEKLSEIPIIPNSIVFFDLDETIIIPKTHFIYGIPRSDNFTSKLKYIYSDSMYKNITKQMENIYYSSKVELVENELTLSFLDQLKQNNCTIIGLTSRSYNEPHTQDLMQNLERLNISFTKTFQPFSYINVEFTNGIIFSSSLNKGKVMIEFLKRAEYTPSNIVFVDDTLSKCQDVFSILKYLFFPFTVYNYVASFERVTYEGMLFQFAELMTNFVPKMN